MAVVHFGCYNWCFYVISLSYTMVHVTRCHWWVYDKIWREKWRNILFILCIFYQIISRHFSCNRKPSFRVMKNLPLFISKWKFSLIQFKLRYANYKDCENGCCPSQPDSVKSALRILLVPIPATLIIIALFFLYLHPINNNVRKKNKNILEIKR